MTTEEQHRRDENASPIVVDGDDDSAAAATAALLSSPVAYFRDALPTKLLDSLRKDAEGLACCSNFWIPKEVLEGSEPPLAAFEQAAAELARRCLRRRRRRKRKKNKKGEKREEEEEENDDDEGNNCCSLPPLHPILSIFKEEGEEKEEDEAEEEEDYELDVAGAEAWCQVYEGGRGLDPHYDKDEEASARGERPLRHPRVSSVVYLNGSCCDENEESEENEEGRGRRLRLGATVVINQRLHPRSGAPLPKVATSSTLLWPTKGSAAFFDGRLAHCVLSSPEVVVDSSSSRRPLGENDDNAAASAPPPSPSSSFDERKRATVLFNFWAGEKTPPGGVLRVTEEDIVAAGLTGPIRFSEEEEGEEEEEEGKRGESRRVAPVAVAVPPTATATTQATTVATTLHLLDDLLRPLKAQEHPFVVVSHAGYELVEAEVHGGNDDDDDDDGDDDDKSGEEEAAAAYAAPRSQVVFIPVSDSESEGDDGS